MFNFVLNFHRHLAYMISVTVCALLALGSNVSAHASECEQVVERCIFNYLMNRDYATALDYVNLIQNDTALIPSKQFYMGLIQWQQGQQQQKEALRLNGISHLHDAVSNLKQADSEKARLLGFGLASGHTARILLYEKQYSKGIRLGKQSLDAIDKYRTSNWVDIEGLQATNILLGIVAFYKANAPDFVKRRVKRVVNLSEQASRDMIESSAKHSGVFTDEAKRILLMEAQWSLPRSCGYLDWAKKLRTDYPKNSDFSFLLQGLLLRCGFPELALEEHNQAVNRFNNSVALNRLQHAKWRALAQLAKSKPLKKEYISNKSRLSIDDKQRLQIALADALYLAGDLNQASSFYQRVLDDTENTAFHLTAQKRLQYGYRKPNTIAPYLLQ